MTQPTEPFHIDQTDFSIRRQEEEELKIKEKTPSERLAVAWLMTCIEYGLDPNVEHRLDRTAFSMRKQTD